VEEFITFARSKFKKYPLNLMKSFSPIKYPGVLIDFVIRFPIYLNFTSAIEKFVHNRYGAWKIF